jgi:membrane protein DedA with SNARE-associated domain/rhodanese-related sulfurtransferase
MPTLIHWLDHISLTAIFGLVLLEQVGLPLPTYPLLVVAGSWSLAGGAPALRVVAVAVAAALIADLGWYFAGQRLGSRVLRLMCRLSLEPDSCIVDTEKSFTRFGTRVLLFAKYVPGLGAVATAMSGVVGASLGSFIAYDLLGSMVWAGSAVALGVLFHDAVGDVFAELAGLGRAGLLLLAVLAGAFLAQKLWRRHQFMTELRMSQISVGELAKMLADGAAPTIVDARSAPNRARDGIIPGAQPIDTIDVWVTDLPSHAEVVVYCSCPNEASAARVAKMLRAKGFHHVRPLKGGIHAWVDAGFAVHFPA